MSIQYRQRGANTPMYAPERDLAHITPTLMRAAMSQLDEDNWTSELKTYLEDHGFGIEDVMQLVKTYVEAQAFYVGEKEVVSARLALLNSGFAALPYALQMVLFASVGQILTGAWFQAVRAVTYVGEDTPCQSDVSQYVSAGLSVVRNLAHKPVDHSPLEAMNHELQAQVKTWSVRCEQQRAKLEVTLKIMTEAQRRITELETATNALENETLWQGLTRYWHRTRKN